MKKIVISIIIILFLMPFLYYFHKYFKESINQRKKVISTRLNGPRIVSAPKERMKAASKSFNEITPDVMGKTTEGVQPKKHNPESNIHDEILGYRLNSKDHIKQIQVSLKKAGFYKGKIDGKMGPRTRRAIKEFQKAKKLNPDGVVGEKTWEALSQYLRD